MPNFTIPTSLQAYMSNNHVKFSYNGVTYDNGESDIVIATSSTSPQIIGFVAYDGYSFNPNNTTKPSLNLDTIHILPTRASYRIYFTDLPTTYDNEYKTVSINFSTANNARRFRENNSTLEMSSNSVIATQYEEQQTSYTVTAHLTNAVAATTNPEKIDKDSNFSLTYTANNNYYISGVSTNIGTAVVSENKESVTITGVATENIIVTVTASIIEYTITNTLEHVTPSSVNPTTLNKNETFILYYDAEDGYLINTASCNIGTVSTSSDKKRVTISGTATANIEVTIKASQESITKYTITENLTNTISPYSNPKEVNEGAEFSLLYLPELDDYYISSATCNIGTVTINQDRTRVTITGTATENIIVNVVSMPTGQTGYTYTVTGLSHCTCNKKTGDEVKQGDVVIVTANTGYQFGETSYEINATTVYFFAVSDDKSQLTFNVTDLDNYTIEDIRATLTPSRTTSQFLRLYQVTENELDELSTMRYTVTQDETIIDYGENILQLYRCYIPISDSIKSQGSIILGKLNTNITSTQLADNIINIETSITVTGLEYNNDYNVTLFIPNNNNPINIPVNYVFNKELKIQLSYELYSNKCNYSLYNDDTVIDCGVFMFGSEVPFRFYSNNVEKDYNYNPPLENYCYLVITGKPTMTVSSIKLNYFSGDLIEINSEKINNGDYQELQEILESGVYM